MSEIAVVKYSLHTSEPLVTAELIECYRDVFAEEPWNEWLQCPKCPKYWGKKDMAALVLSGFQHCDTELADFWPRKSVLDNLAHTVNSSTSCWIVLADSKVIGFCEGYPLSVHDLEKKLGLSLGCGIPRKELDVVAYQADVLVHPMYRDRKLAKKMVAARHDDFLAQGLDFGVVRTRQFPTPSVTYTWYTEKLGYKIVASYPGDDGRVILARELSGLKELLTS